jgi:hypothetical protein
VADTKDEIVRAAKKFFTDLMSSKGRRTAIDTNAFWAAAAALLPASSLKNRKGKEAMLLLGVNYRVVKKAGEFRAAMETSGGGWSLTSPFHLFVFFFSYWY